MLRHPTEGETYRLYGGGGERWGPHHHSNDNIWKIYDGRGNNKFGRHLLSLELDVFSSFLGGVQCWWLSPVGRRLNWFKLCT